MATITNIDIVPNASGCDHGELRATVDGIERSAQISKSEFKNQAPHDLLDAVINRIRSHVLETLPNATFAQIRADLQTRTFKV